jgi:hypothetical protein
MTTSTHLKLPFILPAQAGKHITHNEAIAALDTLAQLAVIDRDLATPPIDPDAGDRYIVGASPTDAWTGKSDQIAAWDGAAWQFHAPQPGWLAFLIDENGLVAWSGGAWQATFGLGGVTAALGINTAPDTTNRLAVKSDAVLLSHDDVTPGTGDIRLTLSKAAPGDTASLLYQTGFEGRAELGIAGDDRFRAKVSPDGAIWHDALIIDAVTAHVGLGTASPTVRLDVDGPVRVKSYTVAAMPDATVGAGQIVFITDESGGATIAFSDGTDWRRVADRAAIS